MVVAIIVTYFPDVELISRRAALLSRAGVSVVIFDNTPGGTSTVKGAESGFSAEATVLGDGLNHGLATAYNRSIAYACSEFPELEGFIFFDQDSFIEKDAVNALLLEYHGLTKKGVKLGLLGARPVDETGKPYRLRDELSSPGVVDGFDRVHTVISSFSFLPFSVWSDLGGFDDRLFIDLVDTEYSMRCTRAGFLNLVSRQVTFTHAVGLKYVSVFGLRSFAISAAFRNYYQGRNVILVGRNHGNWGFIFRRLSTRLVGVILSGFVERDLLARLRFFFKGVLDGARNKGGILEG